jgi:hypothetical protein
MNDREKLLTDIDFHLAKAKEGTALHAILSALHAALTPPEPEPVAAVDEDAPKDY